MQTDDNTAGADDASDSNAPLLDDHNDVFTRPKSVPKFFVLRLLLIYGIFEFHYRLLNIASLILSFRSSPPGPERYIPPSLPPWLSVIAVTLAAGPWLRLASLDSMSVKRVMMLSIGGMFFFAIVVLTCLQRFAESYTAVCIVHLLSGLLGGDLVFGALVYIQLAEAISRPLSRFAIFSFVMGLDLILPSFAVMVLAPLLRTIYPDEGTTTASAWAVCLLIPVVHIVLVHVLLPDTQPRIQADHAWKRLDKLVAAPLTAIITNKRLMLTSSALLIYTMTQSFSFVKVIDAQPFPYQLFVIPPLVMLVLLLVLLPGGTLVYTRITTRRPVFSTQYRFIRLFATWSLLFDALSFIVVPILALTVASPTIPLVVAGLSALTDGVRPALYVLVTAVPSAQLFGGVKILEILGHQISREVVTRTLPWNTIGDQDKKMFLVICGVLVNVLALVVGLINFAGDVDETSAEYLSPNVEDEETSALAPPAGDDNT